MSLFGALTTEMDNDMFYGAHLRHMRQMNNMMSSMFQDPFGMLGGMGGMGAMGGGGHLPIVGLSMGGGMMPFMPQMPQMNMDMNRLMSGGFDHHAGGPGMMGSYSSSTVVMSSGPNGRPQVYSATSSTKVGPNGVKETRKTVEDSMSGVKKMAIGHHIGERAHVVEREQNYISGDAEERQEFINIEEEEVEDFDREFQHSFNPRSSRAAIHGVGGHGGRSPQLAIAPPPSRVSQHTPQHAHSRAPLPAHAPSSPARKWNRPSARRPIRTATHDTPTHATQAASSARETYGSAQPQRPKHHKHHKQHNKSEQ